MPFFPTLYIYSHVYILSARNPPPVCFNVPYLKEYASLCVRFHDLDVTEHSFYGCVRVEAELYHVRVGEKELGCFRLGPKKERVGEKKLLVI